MFLTNWCHIGSPGRVTDGARLSGDSGTRPGMFWYACSKVHRPPLAAAIRITPTAMSHSSAMLFPKHRRPRIDHGDLLHHGRDARESMRPRYSQAPIPICAEPLKIRPLTQIWWAHGVMTARLLLNRMATWTAETPSGSSCTQVMP
jgi:hypothetical protein